MTMLISDDNVDIRLKCRYQMTMSIYQMLNVSDDSVNCMDDPVRCLNVKLFHPPCPGSTSHRHTFAVDVVETTRRAYAGSTSRLKVFRTSGNPHSLPRNNMTEQNFAKGFWVL